MQAPAVESEPSEVSPETVGAAAPSGMGFFASKRVEYAAPWVFGILLGLPVLLVRFPPMIDLPLHEMVISTLRHWNDPVHVPPGLYRLNFGHPNQLFFLIAAFLSLVMSTTWALKVAVFGTIVGISVSAGHVAAYLGASRWVALLVAPLGLGWMFFWGLAANMFGLIVFLLAVPPIDRYLARPTLRGAFAMIGLMALLSFAHETMMITACGLIVLFSMLQPLQLKTSALRLLPVGFAVALFMAQAHILHKLSTPMAVRMITAWHSVSHKLEAVPGVLFAGYEAWVRNLMFVFVLLPLFLFAVDRVRSLREAGVLKVGGWRERAFVLRFEIAAFGLFVAYFAMPSTYKGATLVYHRFLPPAYALFALTMAAVARPVTRPSRVARLGACFVPIGSLALVWPVFVEVHQVYSDLEDVVATMEKGQSLHILDFNPSIPQRLFQTPTAQGHVGALKGGRTSYDFTLSNISLVMMRPEYQWNQTYERIDYRGAGNFRPGFDLQRFRYVLFHTTKPSLLAAGALAMKPEASLVAHKGEWALFRSNLPVVPLLSADELLPKEPRYKKLQTRMREASQALPQESDPQKNSKEELDRLPRAPDETP